MRYPRFGLFAMLLIALMIASCVHRPLSGSVPPVAFTSTPGTGDNVRALHALLGAAGKSVPEDDIERALDAIGSSESNPTGLLSYPMGVGMMTSEVGPELDDLEDAISSGHPVLAALKDPAAGPSRPFYVIVTAFDRAARQFTVSPVSGTAETLGYDDFLRRWILTGRFAFYVEPERHP